MPTQHHHDDLVRLHRSMTPKERLEPAFELSRATGRLAAAGKRAEPAPTSTSFPKRPSRTSRAWPPRLASWTLRSNRERKPLTYRPPRSAPEAN
jgi:hypothetical protein